MPILLSWLINRRRIVVNTRINKLNDKLTIVQATSQYLCAVKAMGEAGSSGSKYMPNAAHIMSAMKVISDAISPVLKCFLM